MRVALLIMAAAAEQAAAPLAYTAPQTSREDAMSLQRMYPTQALRQRDSAAALMDLDVDPEGRIHECRTIAVYGSKSLGERICELQKKVRITPATIDGQPAYGALRHFAAFSLPGTDEGRRVAEVRPTASAEFTVASLPDGKNSLRLGLTLLIAPDGAVSECRAGTGYAAYVSAACEQIARVKFATLQDANGKPVQYVRSFAVEFSLTK